MITHIGIVTVVVKDLSKSLKFYREKLGLRVAFYSRRLKWLTFECGGTTLSLTVPWNREAKKLVGAKTGVSFMTDDIEKTYAQLKRKKVKFHFAPRKEPWGAMLANFQDPDGNQYFLLQMPGDFRR